MGWSKYDANGALVVSVSGGIAPVGAQYVTLAVDGTLTNERVLTGTANQIALADGGAGNAVTLSTPQNIHTGASPEFVGMTLSGLTEGSVVFAGAGGVLSEDNANFFVDNANNRLGVGTDAPAAGIHAYQNSTATGQAAGILVEQAGTGDPVIQFLLTGVDRWIVGIDNSDGDKFKIADGANLAAGARIVITTTGDVGINDIAPSRRLQVVDDDADGSIRIPIVRLESQVSGGAGAAGHGPSLEWHGETSTTEDQFMVEIAARWSVATHASRRSRAEIRLAYQAGSLLVAIVEAPAFATVDGNARGVGAVEVMTYRAAATQVASGLHATLIGGQQGTASGNNSVCIGGAVNVASSTGAVAIGGSANVASAIGTFACGRSATASDAGSYVWSGVASTVSWGAGTWTARAYGGARFYTANAGVAIGVEIVAATGDLVPLAAKTHDLGSAALEWDNIYYVTANTGTSRLVDSKKTCPVCDKQMKRGTGTICIMGEDADYAMAFCINCGNVAVEEWNHHKPGYKARRRSPPEIVVSDIRVKGAGRHREIAVDFRYGDITNSTRLSDDELDIFMNATDNKREQLLHDLGLREWESREESRLMIEDCAAMDEELKEMGRKLIGKNIKRVH